MKTFSKYIFLTAISSIFTLGNSSCGGGDNVAINEAEVYANLEALNFSKEQQTLRTDSLDLYVDYSTCVADAKGSAYFNAVRPTFVHCSPNYYSIKGKAIKLETNDKQKVYDLFATIREVNNADIKEAARRIVAGDKQAILITDAEYYQGGVAGFNTNNPYLAPEIQTWLEKGHDLYVYSENYLEKGKYNKFRYYMIFTDDRIENDLNEIFAKNAPQDLGVKSLHLTSKAPAVSFSEGYPEANEAATFDKETYISYKDNAVECQTYYTGWKDLYSYLVENAVDANGNTLKNGSPLVKGLYAKNTENSIYKITEVGVRVTQMADAYQEAVDSLYNNSKIVKTNANMPELNNIFSIDQNVFQQTGEICLHINKDLTLKPQLLTDRNNVLRIELYVAKAEDNFTNQPIAEAFKFETPTSKGELNRSFFESIRQMINNSPIVNPATTKQVIYTFYINSLEY